LKEAKVALREIVEDLQETTPFHEASRLLNEVNFELRDRTSRDAKIAYEEGERLFRSGRFKEAAERFASVIHTYPETEYAHLAKDAVKRCNQEIVDRKAKDVWDKALSLEAEGKYELALNTLKKIIDEFPMSTFCDLSHKKSRQIERKIENIEAHKLYKSALSDMGEENYRDAISKLEKIGLLYPNSDYIRPATRGLREAREGLLEKRAKMQYDVGEKYYGLGEYKRAIEELQRVEVIAPKSRFVEKAKALIAEITRKIYEEDAEQHFNLAVTLFQQGDLDQAFLQFKEVVDRFPDTRFAELAVEEMVKINKEACDELAKDLYDDGLRYQETGDYQAAILEYDKVLNRFPASYWAPYAQYKKGECFYVWKADFARARVEWERVISTYPHSSIIPDALFHLGDCLERLGNFMSAKEVYLRLVKDYPESPYGRGELAELIAKKLSRLSKGVFK
jgi:TolA-binding protein